MTVYLLLLALMVVCFVLLVLVAKLPASLGLIITAIVVALVAGAGFPLDKFVEGMFGYLDTCLVLITAMVFIKVDLPAPLAPRTATISPACTSRSTPCSTGMRP